MGQVVNLSGLAFVATLLLTSGCATFRMPTPENFVQVNWSGWVFRALTPEEGKLIVRHFTVPEKQNLKFWTESLRNNFVAERGYPLKEEGDFKTDAGLVGHRLLFEISMADVPFCYELVLFATEVPWYSPLRFLGGQREHIFTAEFLCEKKTFEKNASPVGKALKQFRPRRGYVTSTGS